MKTTLNTKDKKLLLGLFLYACVVIIRYFEHTMLYTNTTLYAICYKYGFLSRGFMGSLLRVLNLILPVELFSYQGIYAFSEAMTVVLYFCFFLYFVRILKETRLEDKRNVSYLMIFFSIFSFPMFLTADNFGRLDIFLIMITLISMILILREKAEWLIIPLCAIGMCIHQGFVFTNVNIILVLLFYKAMMGEGARRRKYFILFGLTFLTVSVFFLYFEFGSHVFSRDAVDEIIAAARMTSSDGEYNTSIINHEILGQDVFLDEIGYHIYNYKELPLFLICFLPYILIAYHFFKNLLRGKEKNARIAYLAVLLGALTLLPEWILKVDYGRYVYATAFYYIAIVMTLIAMGDQVVSAQLQDTKEAVKEKMPMAILLLIYPALFMPLHDIIISNLINNFVLLIFG